VLRGACAYRVATGGAAPAREDLSRGRQRSRRAQETIPQHNYRLDAAALEGRRFGEVSCREYRESLLRALPHAWGRLADTHMTEAHFFKHRATRRRSRGADAGGAAGAGADTGGAAGAGGAAADAAIAAVGSLPPNALVAHTEEGMSIVSLYSGASMSILSPCTSVHLLLLRGGTACGIWQRISRCATSRPRARPTAVFVSRGGS
jgi:hypothetical protein